MQNAEVIPWIIHVIMDKAGDEKRALKVDDLLDVFTSISIECGN